MSLGNGLSVSQVWGAIGSTWPQLSGQRMVTWDRLLARDHPLSFPWFQPADLVSFVCHQRHLVNFELNSISKLFTFSWRFQLKPSFQTQRVKNSIVRAPPFQTSSYVCGQVSWSHSAPPALSTWKLCNKYLHIEQRLELRPFYLTPPIKCLYAFL